MSSTRFLAGLVGGLAGTIVSVMITASTNPSMPVAALLGVAGGAGGTAIGYSLIKE